MFKKSNRSAFENFLLGKYERMNRDLIVRSYPYMAAIDPSSICGLQCPFCPTGSENWPENDVPRGHYRKRTTMTVELFDALLDELGEYLFMILFYNWGEPLLNKHLPYFIKRANALDIYTEIHTNLSLRLTDQAMEELLLSGIDEIAASIDGFTAGTYNTYRRGGNFELAKGNIERLAAVKRRLGLDTTIAWNFLVFSFNEHEVEAAKKHCEKLGIVFNKRVAHIDTKTHPGWLPSDRKGELAKSARPEPVDETLRTTCGWHYAYTTINPDGSVSPCCALWDQKYDFGAVGQGVSFAEVWNNKYFKKARSLASGVDAKGIGDLITICNTCPTRKTMPDLYTSLEWRILERSAQVFSGSDSVMVKAFSLLSRESDFRDYYCENFICRRNTPPTGSANSTETDADWPFARLKRELDSVYASKSWRLTYPLRRLSAFMQGIKARR